MLVRIYERGRTLFPVSMATGIVHDLGTEVSTSADAVSVDRSDMAGSADCRFTVPLDRLAPGRYLLAVEAMAGHFPARAC